MPVLDAEGEDGSLDLEVGERGPFGLMPSLVSVRKEVMSSAETGMEQVDQMVGEKRREEK